MRHILYIITRSDDIGGSQIHVRDMSLFMIKKNYKVSVIVGGKGFYIDHLIDKGISVYPIEELKREISFYSDIRTIFTFHKLIKKLSPDIISIHSSKVGILVRTMALFTKIPPCIFTAHGWSFSTKISRTRSFLYLILEKIMAIGTTRLITICNSDFQLARKYKIISERKLKFIHNGMPFFNKIERKERPINHKPRLISVARFETQKDHVNLIEALANLKHLSWELLLVGDGKLKVKIKSLVTKYGIEDRVFFLGRRNDVDTLLNRSDIFILSSLWEGFPRSILEALRASLPVITSNVGGVSESVIDKFNGFVVPIRNSKLMSFAIEDLLKNPQKCIDFGKKGRDLYESKFTFERMANSTYELYSEILDI